MSGTFELTIYVAATGTPLLLEKPPGQTSAAGHVWYVIKSSSGSPRSFGFAPAPELHGRPHGQGKVDDKDFANYEAPLYARTLK